MLKVKMNRTSNESIGSIRSTYWDETREYFKEKTATFNQIKRRRQIEIMKEELEKMIKYKNKKIDKD